MTEHGRGLSLELEGRAEGAVLGKWTAGGMGDKAQEEAANTAFWPRGDSWGVKRMCLRLSHLRVNKRPTWVQVEVNRCTRKKSPGEGGRLVSGCSPQACQPAAALQESCRGLVGALRCGTPGKEGTVGGAQVEGDSLWRVLGPVSFH